MEEEKGILFTNQPKYLFKKFLAILLQYLDPNTKQ